jgi:hypothetical protein
MSVMFRFFLHSSDGPTGLLAFASRFPLLEREQAALPRRLSLSAEVTALCVAPDAALCPGSVSRQGIVSR